MKKHKTKDTKREQIRSRDEAKKRKKRKYYLLMKNTGRLGEYYARKQKIEPIKKEKVSLWRRIVNFIKRMFKK